MRCFSDGDCATKTCILSDNGETGTCELPRNDPVTPLVNCYVQRMPNALRVYLMRQLGIFNVTNTTGLLDVISMAHITQECMGKTASRFNGGFYRPRNASVPVPVPRLANGTMTFPLSVYNAVDTLYVPCTNGSTTSCFILPPSRDACLTSQQCNWANNGMGCLTDVHRNGGFFCGQCTQGQPCQDRYDYNLWS